MKFSLINIKTVLIGFISNAIALFLADQQLAALHIIIHNIFEGRHILLIIEAVEVDILKSCQLEPIRVFDIKDGPPIFYLVILMPMNFTCHQIFFLGEKFDFSRGADYEALIVDQNDLPNISIENFGYFIILKLAWGNCE